MGQILVTGFDAFGDESVNPAALVAKRVGRRPGVVSLQLATSFATAHRQVTECIDSHSFDWVVCLGLAAGRCGISLERLAVNLQDAAIPDNDGNQPVDCPCVAAGPAAYFSTLPIRELQFRLQETHIPTSISNSAGTFVCNQVMYMVIHHITQNRLSIGAGFIHLPLLPEQALKRSDAPSMLLSMQVQAVDTVVATLKLLRSPKGD